MLCIAMLGFSVSGCRGPAFYEKQSFVNPVMQAEDDRGETHLRQKVHYSREAGTGGIGDTAGGGCGCY